MMNTHLQAALLCACALLAAGSLVSGQLTIERNTDDCIYPPIALNGFSMYPNTSYMIQGNRLGRPGDGSTQVVSNAKFQVKYFPTYKMVTNNVNGEIYYLYHCGSKPPAVNGKLFEIPLRSVSADDTSGADFIKQLNLMDRIAFASELAVSNCLQNITDAGYIAPDPHSNPAGADDINDKVDAFITYGDKVNPKAIAFLANGADTPLLRSEWFKYAGLFFNKDVEANLLYSSIRNIYNTLIRAAATAASSSGRPKPVVLWIYKGWNADFVVSYPLFKRTYIQHAGGVLLSNATLSSLGMTRLSDQVSWSIPQLYTDKWAQVLAQADIIVDETYEFSNGNFIRMESFLAAHQISSTAAAGIKAIINRQVYSLAGTTGQPITRAGSPNIGTVGLDWFERGTTRSDEAIKDFIKVITPSTPDVATWKLKWLLQLDYDTNLNRPKPLRISSVCTSSTAKLDQFKKRVTYAVRACPNAVRDCTTGRMTYPAMLQRCAAVSAQKVWLRESRQRNRTADCPIA